MTHDMHSMLPPLGWDSSVHSWHFRPGWTAFALVLLLAYVVGLAACRRHGVRAVHPGRVATFIAGVVLLLLTVSSVVDVYAMAVFWVHMVEHLMLIMVVPALLVVGSPLSVLRAAAATRGAGDAVTAALRSWPVALVTHPLVSLGIYTAVIVATHLTSFMDVMATHTWVMDAEQVLYLASGYLFLLPLLGNEPIRWQLPALGRIALVLVAMTPDTVVGIVLLQTGHDMFPVMFGMHPTWAPSPVRDIQIAGALMWAGGDGLMMLFGIGVVIAMIAHPGHSVLGQRLESVRRQTLIEHVTRGDTEAAAFDDDADVEEDEAMLAAYNRMLGRLSQERQR